MNREGMATIKFLKKKLKEHFKPLGIVAYSGCCRWGCTGSYDEEDDDFQERFEGNEGGIYYIQLFLCGMNYHREVSIVDVHYGSFGYLGNNWDRERQLIEDFCRIVGKPPSEYVINRPKSEVECITIAFSPPLNLEA